MSHLMQKHLHKKTRPNKVEQWMFHHTGTQRTNQYTYCYVILCALHHVHTYPVATQKVHGWFMLVSITMHVQTFHVHTSIKIIALRSYRYVGINNEVMCACSKYDDQDDDIMNTSAFIKFLLVKIFPSLTRKNFQLSKFCTIWYV